MSVEAFQAGCFAVYMLTVLFPYHCLVVGGVFIIIGLCLRRT